MQQRLRHVMAFRCLQLPGGAGFPQSREHGMGHSSAAWNWGKATHLQRLALATGHRAAACGLVCLSSSASADGAADLCNWGFGAPQKPHRDRQSDVRCVVWAQLSHGG